MTASSLSSALPPIDPTTSMGGSAVTPDVKGGDVKAAANGMPFDDVLQQLAAILTGEAADAPAFGSIGAHGTVKAAPAEAPIAPESAPDHAAADAVAPVIVPVPFLTIAPMPTPLVAIPHQAFEAGKPAASSMAAPSEAPIDAPSDGLAIPAPGLAMGDGCEVGDAPIRLTLAPTLSDTCTAPETPSVAIGDADPVAVPAPEPGIDTDAVARVIDLVKKAVPAHDHQAGPAMTGPARPAGDHAAAPRAASASPAIHDLVSQLTARFDDARQHGDAPRDEHDARGQTRTAPLRMTIDDRAAAPAMAARAPFDVSASAPQAQTQAPIHTQTPTPTTSTPTPTHSAPAVAAPAELPVEPATNHASAAPAFAAHVALESPVSAPRLMMAPGFAAHLDAAPAVMDRELPGQIVQAIRMQFAQGGGDAVVRLQPHFLGEVVISIRVEQGLVTAALQSDTPAVRQWIETHEGSLRTALADQGLQLERLVVTGDTKTQDGEDTARRQPGDPESPEQRQRRSRRRKNGPDEQGTFEVFA